MLLSLLLFQFENSHNSNFLKWEQILYLEPSSGLKCKNVFKNKVNNPDRFPIPFTAMTISCITKAQYLNQEVDIDTISGLFSISPVWYVFIYVYVACILISTQFYHSIDLCDLHHSQDTVLSQDSLVLPFHSHWHPSSLPLPNWQPLICSPSL